MPQLVPVDGDPFASPAGAQPPGGGPKLVPVDHDPFAAAPPQNWGPGQYSPAAEMIPTAGPSTPVADPKLGIMARANAATADSFDGPYGLAEGPGFENAPFARALFRTTVKPASQIIDMAQRPFAAAGNATAGAIAGLAEDMGMSRTGADSLERDLRLLGLSTAIAGAASPKVGSEGPPPEPKAALPEPIRPIHEFVSALTGEDVSKNVAAQRIIKRMEQDAHAGGPTAQDMLDIMNATPSKPLTPMDVAGENLQSLAGKVARAPGESRQTITKAIEDRDMAAGTRLAGDVNKGIGAGSAYDAAFTLNDSRAAAAKPAYDTAYRHPPINPDMMKPEGEIGNLMPRPAMRAGMANAMKIAAEEGRNPNVLGIDLNDQGEPVFTRVPSWQTLDYVKRGVDNVVEQYRDKTTGRLVLDTYGRAADQTRYEFRSALRDLNPDYAKALDAYSGPSTTLDALRAGQDFLKQRPEEIVRRLATFGKGDREFYKMGAADTLRIALARKGMHADETKAIMNSQYMRDQLRPLFDSAEEYDRFIKSVEAESRMFNTRYNILGNSKSAARQREDQSPEMDMIGSGARAVAHAGAGSWLSSASHALNALRSYRQTRDPAINAEVARILKTDLSDPAAVARMQALQKKLDTMMPPPFPTGPAPGLTP